MSFINMYTYIELYVFTELKKLIIKNLTDHLFAFL